MLNKVFFVCFLHTKYSRCFVKLTVETLMSRGLFYRCPCYVSGSGNISVALLSMKGQRAPDFIKNILICVLKMNGGLKGLERHEGE